MYSLKTKDDVNKGRFELFEKSYKSCNDSKEVLKKKIRSCDASILPPTKQELLEHVKSTQYISNIWCNAHMRNPKEATPENCGWVLIDGKFEFYWFDGPESPPLSEISSEILGILLIFNIDLILIH